MVSWPGRFGLGISVRSVCLPVRGLTLRRSAGRLGSFRPGRRLGLLALRLAEPNFYLMDEPTNHVDIQGQERLEAEILTHQATCVLVSHDRFFVRAIGSRFMRIEGGRLVEQEGP
jgi:energy-coupling factor transporter ATP-binding protein EcfA2